ncbi:hypothetical protein OBBRIDRAFT_805674 [Obba rivulosa]|uniref:Hydrophobin n=1 Tax=Obba rivulosa TaxID=1052685 RepID=A0A8E2ANZ2_9APHY|nr:hypothetical protein OBBRIDRAFT_805674 [Obba rivulosa]
MIALKTVVALSLLLLSASAAPQDSASTPTDTTASTPAPASFPPQYKLCSPSEKSICCTTAEQGSQYLSGLLGVPTDPYRLYGFGCGPRFNSTTHPCPVLKIFPPQNIPLCCESDTVVDGYGLVGLNCTSIVLF